ncbi:MAG: L-threonylcarbamoyladenylate synthase [Firmicutes bacterium]|nr:L-threonylcarbamoyladenylate synthase [Bacillota bacterium]
MARKNSSGTLIFDGRTHATLAGEVSEAAKILIQGGLVAFPTETVYGLGAAALDPHAVKQIFHAKGRPMDNPLIIHIAKASQMQTLAQNIPSAAWTLAAHFWPGPLTLVLRKQAHVPAATTGGLDSVAIRVPAHPAALALLQAAAIPVAAPSANLSGRPSPTTAAHVLHDLAGRIDAVLDGGPCDVGVESTVLDIRDGKPIVLRPGAVTPAQIRAVLQRDCSVATWLQDSGDKPPSPGLKYLHYAPQAPLYLLKGAPERQLSTLEQLQQQFQAQGKRVGLILSAESATHQKAAELVVLGHRNQPAVLAAHLYDALRYFDEREIDVIIAEGYSTEGMGLALMNRLEKAAGPRVIDVG